MWGFFVIFCNFEFFYYLIFRVDIIRILMFFFFEIYSFYLELYILLIICFRISFKVLIKMLRYLFMKWRDFIFFFVNVKRIIRYNGMVIICKLFRGFDIIVLFIINILLVEYGGLC